MLNIHQKFNTLISFPYFELQEKNVEQFRSWYQR